MPEAFWAERLRRDRQARQLSVRDAVRELRLHADEALPGDETLLRTWKRWESGATKTVPARVYQAAIAAMFGSVPTAYFDAPVTPAPGIVRLTDNETIELTQRLRFSTVGPAAMDALQVTVEALCTDYSSVPGKVVLADAKRWLKKIDGLLNKRLTYAQHRDALAMAGWLMLLVSCLEYDLGSEADAEAARQSAIQMAHEIDNTEIAAWACEIRSWMAVTSGDYYATVAAAREGLAITRSHGVSVQLLAQEAKAWARLRNRTQVEVSLETGRELLSRLDFPQNPRNHFQVDPTKYDFYAMDCWRITGEDRLAAAAAETVVRSSIAPDGRSISPMRLAEAQLTQATVMARNGDLSEALALAEDALRVDRRSLPSLLMIAHELVTEVGRIAPQSSAAHDFEEHMKRLAGGGRT